MKYVKIIKWKDQAYEKKRKSIYSGKFSITLLKGTLYHNRHLIKLSHILQTS